MNCCPRPQVCSLHSLGGGARILRSHWVPAILFKKRETVLGTTQVEAVPMGAHAGGPGTGGGKKGWLGPGLGQCPLKDRLWVHLGDSATARPRDTKKGQSESGAGAGKEQGMVPTPPQQRGLRCGPGPCFQQSQDTAGQGSLCPPLHVSFWKQGFGQ